MMQPRVMQQCDAAHSVMQLSVMQQCDAAHSVMQLSVMQAPECGAARCDAAV